MLLAESGDDALLIVEGRDEADTAAPLVFVARAEDLISLC